MGSPVEATVARSEQLDLWTVIVVGAVAAVATIIVTVFRLRELFSADGITVSLPLDRLPAELALGAEGATVAVGVTEATVLVPNLNALSLVMIVVTIVAQALAVLTVIACAVWLCRNLMRGTAFSRTNTRLVFTASLAVLSGSLLAHAGTTLGLNGALAALAGMAPFGGVELASSTDIAADFWPAYLAAIALGAVAIAFRRGEAMQRDTEGLV